MRRVIIAVMVVALVAVGYQGASALRTEPATQQSRLSQVPWDFDAWLASLTPEHRRKVLNPIPADESVLDLPHATYQPPLANSCSEATTDLVQRESVRLKTADAQLSALPPGRIAQLRAVGSETARLLRAARTAEIWAPTRVESETILLERGLAEAVNDPAHTAYDRSEFVVEHWQGIRCTYDEIYAQALGHMRYRTHAQGWVADRTLQYQFHMLWREPTRQQLQLSRWFAVRLPGDSTGP